MAETRTDLSTRLTRRNSKVEEEDKTDDLQLRADRRDKRKLSRTSQEGESKTKRVKLKSQRKKTDPSSSKENCGPLLHGARQRAVITVVGDEDIPPVVDLNLTTSEMTQEEPSWLTERENVASTLSRMIKVTAQEFITSENIKTVIYVNGGKILLGRFFFASTDSDVVAMKEDFESAGYICHRLDKELLLCKAFQKTLPVFKTEENVISVFSNVNVRAEDVQQLLQVSKHTRLLTFSKEAFILFKSQAERDGRTKSLIEYNSDVHLRFFKLGPPESPPLRNIPANVKTRPDTSQILVLTPFMFRDEKVKNFDTKL